MAVGTAPPWPRRWACFVLVGMAPAPLAMLFQNLLCVTRHVAARTMVLEFPRSRGRCEICALREHSTLGSLLGNVSICDWCIERLPQVAMHLTALDVTERF